MFAVAVATQAILVGIFSLKIKQLRKNQLSWEEQPNDGWPQAEVILCIRGLDETLYSMLDSLAQQNYPGEWRLQIVINSHLDKSWEIVKKVLLSKSKNNNEIPSWFDVNIQELKLQSPKGSLKCASIKQAFESLDPSSQVIALIDSDAVVSKNWLKVLVNGCCQKNIGAVSGNRWYKPNNHDLTGWSRAVWNAGALVLMTLFKIPWGGSLAVRRELISSGLWASLLDHSLCEDPCLSKPLKELNLKYLFIPELLIIDRSKGPNLPDLTKWLARQVLTVRLHHPSWPFVMIHGIGTSLILLLGIISGEWLLLITYEVSCLALLIWIELLALNHKPKSTIQFAIALLIGQILNGWSTLIAIFTKKVEWRGINYRITLRPRGVQILNDSSSNHTESSLIDSDLIH